ncbi:MAG: hypothetical protein A3E85_02605 [Gammaproteobacteria bacterium RIFCSPHIGHO2_12_FULL_45_12]|nr:MAG: hypothetical protein A3E85_02605 [Gammaproteobacteria bacterium RIFCSPHIGHO2_12_FULL_45_12]
MKAIILAGGFGTRLQSVLRDVPKPMAPIAGRPFLAYLLRHLQAQGVDHVILSVHYRAEQIQHYFGTHFNGMTLEYVMEATPLGTGGAMRLALSSFRTNEPVFVLNGDTFVALDYRQMYAKHAAENSQLTFALCDMADCTRYGKVVIDDQHIVAFTEKGEVGRGRINAGVYLIQSDLFANYDMPALFSFESDFIYPNLQKLKPHYYLSAGYFIDIGVPEDYQRAQTELLAGEAGIV